MENFILCSVVLAFFGLFLAYVSAIEKAERKRQIHHEAHERWILEKRIRMMDADAARAHEVRLASEAIAEAARMLRSAEQE